MLESTQSSVTPSNMETVSRDRTAFFRLSKRNGSWQQSGTAHCVLSQQPMNGGPGYQGVFAEWKWDGQRLSVTNDRYGFMPLFYYSNADDFCISGSIPVLLKHGAPADFDYAALGIYLRTGYFLANDTAFAAIKLVPPSAKMHWENGELSVSGSAPIPKPLSLSRQQALDGCISTVRNAVLRTGPGAGPFAVPLSGGRDSRHIVLELLSSGFRPAFCATALYFECWPTSDVEIAKTLCRETGVIHEVIAQDTSMLRGQIQKNIQTSFGTADHVWIPPLVRFLKKKTTRLYEGVACDVFTGTFSSPKRLDCIRKHRFEDFADDVLELNDKGIRALVGEDRFRLMDRSAAIERVAAEARKYAGAGNPVALYFIFNRTRRVTALAPFNLLLDVGTVHTPYLDPEVFDLLCGCPGEMFTDHMFHTDAINLAYPKFADLPYAAPATSRTVRTANTYRFFARIAWDLAGFSAKSNSGALLVDRTFLWPRLLRSMLDWRYSQSMSWISEISILLIHLELAATGKLLDLSDLE